MKAASQTPLQEVPDSLASHRVSELSERLGLNLSYSLSSNVKLLAYFFQSSRTSVLKSESECKNLFLSVRKRIKHFHKLLFEQCKRRRVCRSGDIVIGYEISQMAVFFLADRRFKRNRFLRYLHYLSYLIYGHIHFLCQFFRRGLSAQFLYKLSGYSYKFVYRFNHMDGYTYSSCLIRYGTGYSLTYPPCCVCGKLISLSVIEFFNRFYKTEISFLYQVKGEGTHKLAALKKDDTLTVTGPCGNGFDTAALAGQYKRIAVVGGGIGTAPLLLLCKELCRAGVRPDLFVGFRDTTYGMDRFVPWCRDIYAATDSGKEGHHGLVTDLLAVSNYDIVLTCGPMVMMRGVAKLCAAANVPCLASLEKKMACGLGACLGCTCHTKIGPVTVCKDGPVFNAQEVFD